MRTLLVFTKTGRLRFLSHLDFTRLFRRAFRRAEIDIQYTEGFNPQQKISVANPLPLGYESTMEFMLIETDTAFTEEKRKRLNAVLPEGVEVTACTEPEPFFDLHKTYVSSAYEWREITPEDGARLYDALKEWLQEEHIIVTKVREKKGRRRVQTKDIKPLIEKVELQDGRLFTRLCSHDAATLRPGELLLHLREHGYAGEEHPVFRRVKQFSRD